MVSPIVINHNNLLLANYQLNNSKIGIYHDTNSFRSTKL